MILNLLFIPQGPSDIILGAGHKDFFIQNHTGFIGARMINEQGFQYLYLKEN